jgi:hypothetical protein
MLSSGLVGELKLKCFEFHAGGLKVDPLGSLLLLYVSLDVFIGLGAVISVDGFTLSTIRGMRGSAWRFLHEVFIEKNIYFIFVVGNTPFLVF